MVTKIASFVNQDLDTSTLQRIVDQTSFQSMRTRPAFDHSWFGKKPGPYNFVRKGQIGDWKNHFTDDQNKLFEERFNDEMKDTGISLKFFE